MEPNPRFRPKAFLSTLTLLVLALWTGTATAEIFIVDCDEGPDVDPWTHTTISEAVGAAVRMAHCPTPSSSDPASILKTSSSQPRPPACTFSPPRK